MEQSKETKKPFLKTCYKCRKQKWNSEFYIDKRSKDGLASMCKECESILGANNHLKRKYGITLEDYEIILKKQNEVCKICKQPETIKDKNGNIRPLSVDHCHKTNRVRGLLCNKCNNALGNFNDNPETLKQAIKYLEENQ